MTSSAVTSAIGNTAEILDCIVCAEHCCILGVFTKCGHCLCHTCALRIHAINDKGCPICREKSDTVLVTRRLPKSEEGFDMDDELGDLLRGTQKSSASGSAKPTPDLVKDSKLKCFIEGAALAEHVRKLYEYVCPQAECWVCGEQEPFVQEQMLAKHLEVDHGLRYCSVCLKHRPAFLSEQHVYTLKDYEHHLAGCCPADPSSFQGHPPCKFCSERFYDGEHLLKHMQHAHFTCDVCNRGEFTFTYYKSRPKLLEHFQRCHRLCDHPDCANLDPMLRVFLNDLDLQAHRQRAHGAGNRGVSLEALGFRFSYESNNPMSSSSPQPSVGPGGAPATGANSHTLRITFDHVSRREDVNTMPNTGDAAKNRSNGGRNKQDAKGVTALLCTPHFAGLPIHYVSAKMDLTPLARTTTDPVVRVSSSSAASKTLVKPSWGKGGAGANPAAAMSGKSSGGRNTGSSSMADQEDLNRQFEEKIDTFITNPRRAAEFRYACSDYMSNKMLAKEFYSMLKATFFPSAEQFDEIFPLLVATMPHETKSEALKHIHQMLSAPEVVRLEKAREEEECTRTKAAADQARRKQIAATKKNPWATRASAAPSATTAASTANGHSPQPAAAAGAHWGSRQPNQLPPPSLSPTYVDPGDFPELPGALSNRARQSAQPARPPLKNNSWFARK